MIKRLTPIAIAATVFCQAALSEESLELRQIKNSELLSPTQLVQKTELVFQSQMDEINEAFNIRLNQQQAKRLAAIQR